MRLMIDARTLGSRPSGIGIYTHSYIQELRKNPQIELSLLSDVSESDELTALRQQGVQVILYGRSVMKSAAVFGYFRFVQKELLRWKPDIFWEPNNLIPVHLKNPGGKIIVTVHDLFPITTPEYFSMLYRMYFRYGIRKTLHHVDGVLYDSRETEQEADRRFPFARKIKSIVAYVIVEKRAELPITDKGYFLYVGNLERRKGTDLLLKAYRQYRAGGGEQMLYLAGKVRDEEVQNLMEEVQKDSHVKYLGYVSDQEKDILYANCSCLVFPSKAEGFGIPPLEIMSYDKPVIASDLAIFREILGDCVNYFSLVGTEEKQAERYLCDHMKKFSPPDTNSYREVEKKYTGETLGRALMKFLEAVQQG